MKVLAIGDIVAVSGRKVLQRHLASLKEAEDIDYCLANGENSAGGLGIDRRSCEEILEAGVDVITTGNHVWSKRAWLKDIDSYPNCLRPANGPQTWPGQGYYLAEHQGYRLLIVNLMGSAFLQISQNPFSYLEENLEYWREKFKVKNIFIDFHAEATAEKIAMGHYLTDRVTAVFGTHTHVQTADERILGQGTAYITDLGMTGPMNGVIGMSRERALDRFVRQIPASYEPERGPCLVQGVVIDFEPKTGQARSIKRISLVDEEGY